MDRAALGAQDTDEQLTTPLQRNTEPWQLLHGLIAHTAYHTAQIIMLRRLQGIWIVDWREWAKKIY